MGAADNTIDPQVADVVAELIENGAEVHCPPRDTDPYVLVFHRTTEDAARAIRETGTMTGAEDGLFFSTRPDGQATGYGPAVVALMLPVRHLVLDDVFGDEAHVRVPLPRAGMSVDVSACLARVSAQQ